MRFYAREVAGWCLLALGLAVFYACYTMLLGHYIIEAGELTFIGFIIFRGGIHLLKVAVAARVCMEAQDRLAERQPPAPERVAPRLPAPAGARPPGEPRPNQPSPARIP